MSSTPSSSVRLAVDVGGTFTDVVSLDTADGTLHFDKVPTTPSEPTKGVLNAFSGDRAPAAGVAMFTHGTTLGLNALLTRTGARTAVIVTTRGFRDVYLLGRTDRTADVRHQLPPGPRHWSKRYDTFEVPERSLFDGTVHHPLDRDAARAVAGPSRERGYRAVAVAFLHSYANPAHELQMREILDGDRARGRGHAVARAVPRIPGVRAHQHRGTRCLCQADRPALPDRAARASWPTADSPAGS